MSISSENKEQETSTRGQQNVLLLVATGILIPLIALAFPYIIDFFSPKAALVFEAEGPIQVENTKALSVMIKNEGKSVEKNVEIWLPSKLEKGKFKLTATTPITYRNESEATVITIGDLRPSERVQVALLIEDGMFFVYEHSIKDLRIVSTERVATWDGLSTEWDFIYRAGFWGFLVLLALVIFLGIYQEHFMARTAKEKLILREIDKLK